jgi:hypothetical protein
MSYVSKGQRYLISTSFLLYCTQYKFFEFYMSIIGFGTGTLIIKGYPQDADESLKRFHGDKTKAFMHIYTKIIGTDRLEALAGAYPELIKDAWPE